MVKVFSFCIYGSGKKYLDGLTANLDLIAKTYIDFEAWIYYNNISYEYLLEYSSYKFVKMIPFENTGTDDRVVRHFAIDDKSVDVVFGRDADSRIEGRDVWCINEFLKSDKGFHIIRDHFWHRDEIMAGMYGIKKGALKVKVKDLYDNYCSNHVGFTDQKFISDTIYPLVRNDALIHSDLLGFKGEKVFPIESSNSGFNFVGQVYDPNPVFNYHDFPCDKLLEWLRFQERWDFMIKLDPGDIRVVPHPLRYKILDELYMAYYYLDRIEDCQRILLQFQYTHIDDHIINNSNYLFGKLRKAGKIVIGTTDPKRLPQDNEIIVCYGSYCHTHECLPGSNRVIRHPIYEPSITHDKWEFDLCWSQIGPIYIANLKERRDRFMEVLCELAKMGAPLCNVVHYQCSKETVTGDKKLDSYIGATKNHVDMIEMFIKNGEENCLILEDDFTFNCNLEDHKEDLTKFFEKEYDFNIAFVSYSKYHNILQKDELMLISKQECTTSSGYILSKKTVSNVYDVVKEGYDLLVKTGDHGRYCIDRYWAKMDKLLLFKRKFGYQRPNYSSITGAIDCHFD